MHTKRKLTEFDVLNCSISNEKIEINDIYKMCDFCKLIYHNYAIDNWLKNSNTCPHCKVEWYDNTTYINNE